MSAVEVTTGLWRIPTAPHDLINVFLLADEDGSLTLVDAGLRRADGRILAAINTLGLAPQDVRRIVVTHAHRDHAGGLARMKQVTGATVHCHDREATYLQQGVAPRVDHSCGSAGLFNRFRGSFAKVEVADTFQDGAVLPMAGGLRVIHTPGHTPGHVSLLHEPTRVLITGDALFNLRGLRYAPSSFCTNIRLSRETVDRLGDLDYETAAFAHGAHIRSGGREAVRSFLRGRPR